MTGLKSYSFIGYLTYLIQGTRVTSLAVIMPILKEQLGLTYESTGMVFSMGMLGYFAGSVITGLTLEKSGCKIPSIIGYIFISLGMIGIILSGNSLFLSLSNFICSLGTALLQISLPSIAKKYTSKTGKILNLFYSLFALGAMLTPLILGLLMNNGISWKYFYTVMAMSNLIPFSIMIRLKIIEDTTHKEKNPGNNYSFLKMPLFWLMCIAVSLYILTESGINSWSPMVAHDFLGYKNTLAGILPSLFWLGLFLGRFISSRYVDKVGKSKWLILVLLAGIPVIFLSQKVFSNFVIISIMIFLAGIIHSSIYPTLQSLLVDRIHKGLGYALSIFASFGGSGGILSGFIIGNVSKHFGIQNGYFSIFYFFLILFVVVSLIFIKDKKSIK